MPEITETTAPIIETNKEIKMFYHYLKSVLAFTASVMKALLVLLVVVVAFGVAYWIGDLVGSITMKVINIIL